MRLKKESYKITGDPKKPDGAPDEQRSFEVILDYILNHEHLSSTVQMEACSACFPFRCSEFLCENDMCQSKLPGSWLEGTSLRLASCWTTLKLFETCDVSHQDEDFKKPIVTIAAPHLDKPSSGSFQYFFWGRPLSKGTAIRCLATTRPEGLKGYDRLFFLDCALNSSNCFHHMTNICQDALPHVTVSRPCRYTGWRGSGNSKTFSASQSTVNRTNRLSYCSFCNKQWAAHVQSHAAPGWKAWRQGSLLLYVRDLAVQSASDSFFQSFERAMWTFVRCKSYWMLLGWWMMHERYMLCIYGALAPAFWCMLCNKRKRCETCWLGVRPVISDGETQGCKAMRYSLVSREANGKSWKLSLKFWWLKSWFINIGRSSQIA